MHDFYLLELLLSIIFHTQPLLAIRKWIFVIAKINNLLSLHSAEMGTLVHLITLATAKLWYVFNFCWESNKANGQYGSLVKAAASS